jgi:polyisoprenyl-phosphate glycosyltransferase
MELSIVIPIYNEAAVIPELHKRLLGLIGLLYGACGIGEKDVEFVLVNDGSRDESLALLLRFFGELSQFKIVNFSRNFGHQIAVSAGIDIAKGNAVVLIDADLQDPPEFIADLYKKYREGFDVVYAVRAGRKGETFFKRITAKFFYRLLRWITKISIPVDTGDFRIMSRRTVDTLKGMPERHRFLRGMVAWIGFNQTGIPYQRRERFAGSTKYPFHKMVRFAVDAITSFSTAPVRVVMWFGFLSSLAGLLYSVHVLYIKLFTSKTVPGWSSLMVAILIMSGIQMITLGVIGEYVGRITEEIKKRPLYIIDRIFEHDQR